MLKIAIIGFGHIGKLHYQVLQQSKLYSIVAIVDTVKKEENNIPFFNSIEDLIRSKISINLVSICTPNGLHYEHAIFFLQNKFTILIEKPVTLSSKNLKELILLSEKNKCKAYTAMQLRFSPIIQFIYNLLKKNALGDIYITQVECFWNRNDEYYNKNNWHGTQLNDGGVLFTQFSHFIDILHYFFFHLKIDYVNTKNFNHTTTTEFEDSGIIQFSKNNMIGNIIYTTSVYQKNYLSSITIIGEKGTIKISGQYMNQLEYCDVKDVKSPNFNFNSSNYHSKLYEEIHNSITKKQKSILEIENAINMITFIENVNTF